MESANGYEKKLDALEQALTSLKKSMAIDASRFGAIEADTIQSGQVQKFEICVELFWKTTKKYLYDIHGIEAISPKMAMKQLYQTQYVHAENYETLIEMVNDRNRLSHVYDEDQFKQIYCRLPEYMKLMDHIAEKFRGNYGK